LHELLLPLLEELWSRCGNHHRHHPKWFFPWWWRWCLCLEVVGIVWWSKFLDCFSCNFLEGLFAKCMDHFVISFILQVAHIRVTSLQKLIDCSRPSGVFSCSK
jgi:hypothetical protein